MAIRVHLHNSLLYLERYCAPRGGFFLFSRFSSAEGRTPRDDRLRRGECIHLCSFLPGVHRGGDPSRRETNPCVGHEADEHLRARAKERRQSVLPLREALRGIESLSCLRLALVSGWDPRWPRPFFRTLFLGSGNSLSAIPWVTTRLWEHTAKFPSPFCDPLCHGVQARVGFKTRPCLTISLPEQRTHAPGIVCVRQSRYLNRGNALSCTFLSDTCVHGTAAPLPGDSIPA
jgi:hypothetical protein